MRGLSHITQHVVKRFWLCSSSVYCENSYFITSAPTRFSTDFFPPKAIFTRVHKRRRPPQHIEVLLYSGTFSFHTFCQPLHRTGLKFKRRMSSGKLFQFFIVFLATLLLADAIPMVSSRDEDDQIIQKRLSNDALIRLLMRYVQRVLSLHATRKIHFLLLNHFIILSVRDLCLRRKAGLSKV